MNGEVCVTPEKLVDWHAAAASLPAALSNARYPMVLDEVVSVQLVWCPVRADNAEDGMVLTPVWVVAFNAHDAEQAYEHMNAVYAAIDGRLIDGNWM